MSWTRDEAGSVMVEYALVLSLLSLAFIGGMFYIDFTTSQTLGNLETATLHYGLRDGK
jgi:Flp pilus assembly pilin Flp